MDKIAVIGWGVLSQKEEEFLGGIFCDVMEVTKDAYYYHCLNTDSIPLEELKIKDQKLMMSAVLTEIEGKYKGAVLLGPEITKLAGKSNFKKSMSKILTDDHLPCPMMVTADLRTAMSNSSMMLTFAKDLNKAYEVATDTFDDSGSTAWEMITTKEKLKEVIGYIKETGACSFDFETVKVDKKLGTFHPDFKATALSLSFQHGSSYVMPLEHFDTPITMADMWQMLGMLRDDVFENPDILKIAHNISFDAHVLRYYGIGLEGRLDDTMLMHHLIDETLLHGLKELVATYYPQYAGYDDDLAGMDWSKIPLGLLCKYNAVDSDMTFRLKTILEQELMNDERSYIIYRNLTIPGWKALFKAECHGMLIDRQYILDREHEVEELRNRIVSNLNTNPVFTKYFRYKKKEALKKAIEDKQLKLEEAADKTRESTKNKRSKIKEELSALLERVNEEGETKVLMKSINSRIDKLEHLKKHSPSSNEQKYSQEVRDLKLGNIDVLKEFNFGSPAQLSDLLYDCPLGFKFLSLDKGTGKEILEDLEDDTGFLDDLLLLRTVDKIQGTYLKGIEERLDKDSYLHTTFKLNGTRSGRLSSANPNLQNMPNAAKLKNEDAAKVVSYVKSAFVVPEGYTLVQLDYSQAELRTIAFFAGEETMLKAYENDLDLHILTASVIMGVSVAEFMILDAKTQKEWRSKAKAVNFGLIYGMGAKGFKHYAKTSYGVIFTLEEATNIRDAFFSKYSKLVDYHNKYKQKARKYGWVRTFFGRRRRTPDILSPIDALSSADERVAINSPIQGSVGEFMVFAMALLNYRLHPLVKMVNTVHDSILLYIPDELLDEQLRIAVQTSRELPMMQYFGKELTGITLKVDAEVSKDNWKSLQEYENNF